MNELKPATARPSFWCAVLNGDDAVAAPAARARTVRGPYSTFTSAPQKAGRPEAAANGPRDGETGKSRK